MDSSEQRLLHQLLTSQRVLSLSVLIKGDPYVGLLPYAVRPDLSALVIHASGLALHSKGLSDGAPFGALIQIPDHPGLDALQIPRVSLQGSVQMVPKSTDAYAATRDFYLSKFPSSQMTFMLGDFNLYDLKIEKGRFVAGFGSAHTVSKRVLAELSAAADAALSEA